jgi:hypothetical protein
LNLSGQSLCFNPLDQKRKKKEKRKKGTDLFKEKRGQIYLKAARWLQK